jgi:MFS family permease
MPSRSTAQQAASAAPAGARATTAALLFAAFWIGAGQNLLAPLLSALSLTFFGAGGSASQRSYDKDVFLAGGSAAAFFLAGGPLAAAAGAAADAAPSRRALVVALCVAAAAAAAAQACAWAAWQFIALRALAGGVFGAAGPLLLSVLGDLAPAERRPAMAAAVSLALGGGTALGQIAAGLLLDATPLGWRAPFALDAAGCAAAAALVFFFAAEPRRGGMDGAAAAAAAAAPPPPPLSLPALRAQAARVLAVRTNRRIFAQALCGTLPWAVISSFLPDFLTAERGFSAAGATALTLGFGLGAAAGGVAGGAAGSALAAAAGAPRAAAPLLCAAAQAAAAAPLLWLLNAPLRDAAGGTRPAVWPVAAAAGFAASLAGPNLKAMLLNANAPAARASALAAAYLADAIAKGLAPALLGLAVARVGSRQAVFSAAVAGWLGSAAVIATVAHTLADDERDAAAGALQTPRAAARKGARTRAAADKPARAPALDAHVDDAHAGSRRAPQTSPLRRTRE